MATDRGIAVAAIIIAILAFLWIVLHILFTNFGILQKVPGVNRTEKWFKGGDYDDEDYDDY